MEYLKYFVTFDGRINRLTFIAYEFIASLSIFLLSYIFSNINQQLGAAATFIAFPFWIWISICIAAKRAHDLGRPGWFGLVLFVPILNLVLLVLPGYPSTNEYGDIPEKSSLLVTSIAGINIVWVLASILFGIAIFLPSSGKVWGYKSYCNNPNHKEYHKLFIDEKRTSFNKCDEHSNWHFDEYRGHATPDGESHSSGCKLVKAPFPWSLSME